MRKALSLVEVLVAIILITVVIGSMLQMKSNNIFFLEKFNDTILNNSYILFAQSDKNKEDQNIYLDKVVDFKDDDIRKELKQIKVVSKLDDKEEMKLPNNDYIKTAKILTSTYIIDDKTSKTFYKFKLQY